MRQNGAGVNQDCQPHLAMVPRTGVYGSMIKMGILDPLKVTRSALQNAASVAAMVLTTESLVTDLPEEKDDAPGGMPGGGMGGGMPGMGM